MKKIIWLIILVAVAICMLATCPTAEDHKKKIGEVITEYVNDKADEKGKAASLISSVAAAPMADAFLSHTLKVSNYRVLSVGRFKWDGEERVVSVGIFGHVFTFNKEMLDRELNGETEE